MLCVFSALHVTSGVVPNPTTLILLFGWLFSPQLLSPQLICREYLDTHTFKLTIWTFVRTYWQERGKLKQLHTFLKASCLLPHFLPQNLTQASLPPELFPPLLLHRFLFQSQLFSLDPSLLHPITWLSQLSPAARAGSCSHLQLSQAEGTPQAAY